MSEIKFSDAEKSTILPKIQMYLREELDLEVGSFDAEFLLDFFAEEVGNYFYNRGLYDAQAILEKQVEEIGESIYQLEKPTEFSR
jgi:uncharacterized protein (DUF2164 family)